VSSCAFCGRENEEGSRFCMDCGKPLTASAARSASAASGPVSGPPSASTFHLSGGSSRSSDPSPQVPPPRPTAAPSGGTVQCANCGGAIDRTLAFCAHCGKRTGAAPGPTVTCPSCATPVRAGTDFFCSRCGTSLTGATPRPTPASPGVVRNSESAALARARTPGPKLAILDDNGAVEQTFSLDRGEAIVGRMEGDLRFPDDIYLSPLHAHFSWREGQLWLRDLGSRNGSWIFIDSPCRLSDGDLLLLGSQMLRFRRLGYPGPHPPEADLTRRMGSLTPSADIAVLQQLRNDGSVRDTLHLSPGRSVSLGRESGDWVFGYDQTMSGRHAEIRSEDNEFVIQDAGSRNGVALAVRGERALRVGNRVMLGDQILRVERL
jgi:pSer/pThr/pTyr-binding forkhead associated (FHA) protein